ncbi:MAG: GNAT family N-acetyltransferase, partial [Sphaerochaeta sp.]
MQASNTPRLETKRLIVRKFTIDDIQALYRIFSDREMNAFLPWYPVTSLQEAEKLYRVNYAQQYQQRRAYQYAICHKSDDIPIGYVHLSDTESRDLGFGLIPPFWGQGIVTEACMAVIAQAKEDNVPYITATHDVNNPRSGEVMKRLGMTYRYSY